jgi:hypothetical protein
MFDSPPAASARQQQQLCYRAALDGDTAAAVHQFYYRDIGNGSRLVLKNPVTFAWSSDPSTYIPAPELFLDPDNRKSVSAAKQGIQASNHGNNIYPYSQYSWLQCTRLHSCTSLFM